MLEGRGPSGQKPRYSLKVVFSSNNEQLNFLIVLTSKLTTYKFYSDSEELNPEEENALRQFLCENVAMGNFLKGLTDKLQAVFGEQDSESTEKR